MVKSFFLRSQTAFVTGCGIGLFIEICTLQMNLPGSVDSEPHPHALFDIMTLKSLMHSIALDPLAPHAHIHSQSISDER